MPVNYKTQFKYAANWIKQSTQQFIKDKYYIRIANELINIDADQPNNTYKKRAQVYKLIYTNKAYIHYRWK